MKSIIFVNKHGLKFKLDNMELAEAIEKLRPSIGLDARWLPDFLEGAETRQTLVQPAFEYPAIDLEGNPTGEMIQSEAVYLTEYLHQAEYTYVIEEETLATIKARKLAELSAESIAQNNELKAWNEYRASNILAGVYDETKTQNYISAYKAKSELLRNKYYELKAIVESCITEEQINAITFTVE